MTAEVAILNRSGIAIAADSAVTVGGERVWMASNKLFSLGPAHDIAIMIYGSGDFVNCPWELIIQSFKAEVCKENYSKIEDCKDAFLDFLKGSIWYDSAAEELSLAHFVVSRIEYILDGEEYDDIKSFNRVCRAEVKRLKDELQDREVVLADLPRSDFIDYISPYIPRFVQELSEYKPSKSLVSEIADYIYSYFTREHCNSGYESGIVFLGYGTDQIYPVVKEIIVDGRFKDFVRYWNAREADLNSDLTKQGVIISFAQTDMTKLFMEGISSNYVSFFNLAVAGILEHRTESLVQSLIDDPDQQTVEMALQRKVNEKIVSELGEAFNNLKKSEVTHPLIKAIRALPRQEMAAMAEAFVELTSMRRKFDSTLQSVGGPVDVAFISKSDGLVWLKRKLYFDQQQNGDFFKRRDRRLS